MKKLFLGLAILSLACACASGRTVRKDNASGFIADKDWKRIGSFAYVPSASTCKLASIKSEVITVYSLKKSTLFKIEDVDKEIVLQEHISNNDTYSYTSKIGSKNVECILHLVGANYSGSSLSSLQGVNQICSNKVFRCDTRWR